MKTPFYTLFSSIALIAVLTACGGGEADQVSDLTAQANGGPDCIEICHVPPGNPSNAHTICVNEAAVKAHIGRHGGDFFGRCDQCEWPKFVTEGNNVGKNCAEDCRATCDSDVMDGVDGARDNFLDCLEFCIDCGEEEHL